MAFTSSVGTRGLFTLLTPFDTAMTPNVAYTVAAIRSLADIIAAGEDPYALFYQPANISQDDYQADVTNNALIVTFQSDGGQFIYVSDTYISAAPTIGGVPYTTLALAISLGPIPDSLDISALKQKLIDTITETIGVTSTITTIAISPTEILSYQNAAVVEAARLANITINTTDYAMYLHAQTQLQSAQQQIELLSDYIKTHHT